MCVVSPTAAHQVAAVGLLGGFVAQATVGPQAAGQGVGLAVVRRPLDVDQLRVHGLPVGMGFLDLQEGGTLVSTGLNRLHVDRLVVPVLEEKPQLAELGKRGPAGFGGAGS